MKHRRSRLSLGIRLVVLCSGVTLVGLQPVEAQTADVLSLPGDAPGAKVAFHRRAELSASAGQAFTQKHFEFPGASEVRIETVTASCKVPATQVVSVELVTSILDDTADAYIVFHQIALVRTGTFLDIEGESRALYQGTHYLRLLAKLIDGPPVFGVNARRSGGKVGTMNCVVTVAGYTTPGGSTRP